MKIIKKISDAQHFTETYYFFGIKIYTKKRFYDLYCMYRRYQDRANVAAKYLSFCDIRKCRQAKDVLRSNQLKVLDLLKTVCNIAEENDLVYWIDFGTLLGSYRHGGFVPWDKDGDISMPRKDYDKILPLLKKYFENKQEYVVRESLYGVHQSTQDFWHFQIRVCLVKDKVGVDIFPIDDLKASISNKDISKLLMDGQEQLKIQLLPTTSKTEFLKKSAKIIEQIKNKLGSPQRRVCFYGLDYPIKRCCICHDYSDVFPLKKSLFEGCYFYSPKNIEQYLEDLYNTYNNFPSLDFDYCNRYDKELQKS